MQNHSYWHFSATGAVNIRAGAVLAHGAAQFARIFRIFVDRNLEDERRRRRKTWQ
jgi:hypothetical protein